MKQQGVVKNPLTLIPGSYSTDPYQYLLAKIVSNIATTLYGLKPASLISFCRGQTLDLCQLWDAHKKALALPKQFAYLELKQTA